MVDGRPEMVGTVPSGVLTLKLGVVVNRGKVVIAKEAVEGRIGGARIHKRVRAARDRAGVSVDHEHNGSGAQEGGG
eukprot:554405-Lingulodinium_polyedra.AAC.1